MPIQLLIWEASKNWQITVRLYLYGVTTHLLGKKFLLNLLNIQIYFSFILNNPLILSSVGEYSGGPNEQQTYAYAKTVLDLMCKHPHEDGKILIIGGGIANFTNVADTFKVR